MKGILDSWGVDPFYLFVVMFIIQIVMIVLYVMLNTKYRRLQKSYVTFMRGKNGKNLEKSIFGKFDELDEIAVFYVFRWKDDFDARIGLDFMGPARTLGKLFLDTDTVWQSGLRDLLVELFLHNGIVAEYGLAQFFRRKGLFCFRIFS